MFLQTQELSKEFGKLRAVSRVNLEIVKGDIHAIIGPNGAGKSTFFNLITGYHRATTGRVLYRGQEITKLPAYKRCRLGITRSFQITSIYPKLTVYESVLMALLCQKLQRLGRAISPWGYHLPQMQSRERVAPVQFPVARHPAGH